MPGTTNYTTPGLFDSHSGGDPLGFAELENLKYTALSVDVNAVTSSIDVVSTTGFPTRGSFAVGTEIITYTGLSGGVQFTGCVRGVDGTTAAAHAAGATVGIVYVAANHNDLAAAIVAIEAAVPRKLAEVTLGAAAATIDFNNIPQTYAGLLLHLYARNDTVGGNINGRLSSDGTTYDAGANYDWQYLAGSGAVAVAGEVFATTSMLFGAQGAAANVFSMATYTIPNYANAVNHKTVLTQAARKIGTATGEMSAYFVANFWRNTAAIKGIRLLPSTNNFAIGTRAVLYGLPG